MNFCEMAVLYYKALENIYDKILNCLGAYILILVSPEHQCHRNNTVVQQSPQLTLGSAPTLLLSRIYS